MRVVLFGLICLFIVACKKNESMPENQTITIDSVLLNHVYIASGSSARNIDYRYPEVKITFSAPVDTTKFQKSKIYFTVETDTFYTYYFSKDSKRLFLHPQQPFKAFTSYRMLIDEGKNFGRTFLNGYTISFFTSLDTTPKFPLISDDSLMTLVENRTFRYFWDYGHPVSGLARERLGSGDIVTTGGSGFGLMAMLVGIERHFVTRQEGFQRLLKIVNFLNAASTTKFHGAFPHWMNGSTGAVYPFSTRDDGGDIVETAFLFEGLLTVKEYFKNGSPEEVILGDSIQKLWEKVEWSWYQQNNQNKLFWHWSPTYGWDSNMTVSGWNEALMVYILAASSPTYPITKKVYDDGWAQDGAIKNGKSFYGIQLPLGEDRGGPLFFAHYSFMGLDPRHLKDFYASYWTQNVAHAMINYNYCKANPKNYTGYGANCWGLTASDIANGYSASSPNNDLGVIAPTAALASFPYSPNESRQALNFFYYTLGDKIWGTYGFTDAFNLTSPWFASSYLAIDEGPIICMMENYRSGLLWTFFMQSADVQRGLTNLNFTF